METVFIVMDGTRDTEPLDLKGLKVTMPHKQSYLISRQPRLFPPLAGWRALGCVSMDWLNE